MAIYSELFTKHTGNVVAVVTSLLPLAIALGVILFFSSCASTQRNAQLSAVMEEGKNRFQIVKQALVSVDAAAAKAEGENVDWSSPSEVVLLQSSHEEIDRSAGARRVSDKLRSMGSTSITMNGQAWTVTSGGMKRLVWDQVSIKTGGLGQRLTWDQESMKKIIAAANELKQAFVSAGDGLKRFESMESGDQWATDLVKKCEAGVITAEQISGAAKEILPGQQAGPNNAKPDEKVLQGAIERMLNGRSILRDVTSGYDTTLKQIAQNLKK